MTEITLAIALDDTDLTIGSNGEYSYSLEGLTHYTQYTFTLSTVYGDITSDSVTASITTSEGGKRTYARIHVHVYLYWLKHVLCIG